MVAVVALIAAPVALANGDTITASKGVPVHGHCRQRRLVLRLRRLPRSTGATGRRRTSGTYDSTSNVRQRNPHLRERRNVHRHGHDQRGRTAPRAPDTFTANVTADVAQFTQCPAVYLNSGCQFLITVNTGTETVMQDTNQGPYEGADDSLIGVQNNSSSPVSELPLSVPNSDLFGFDSDGICDPGGLPIPSGCVPQAGAPAGTVCEAQSTNCSFPAPPGEPAGYTEPGASGSGLPQNGYEGPTSWFSNVSTDESSGVVHFSPAIPPGGSTYFSLEEPPVGTNDRRRRHGALSRRDVATDGLRHRRELLGPREPERAGDDRVLPVRARPQIQQVRRLGARLHQLDPGAVDRRRLQRPFRDRIRVGNLVPNALYHVRLVATNGSGTTFGPDMTFTTSHGATPGSPTLGKTFNVSTVSGLVLVKIHGKFIPLTELTQIPKNTEINAIHGTLSLITAAPGGSHPTADVAAKGKKGKKGKTVTQKGNFGGAIFKISQATGGAGKGLVTLSIVEGAFKGAPSYSLCTKHKAGDATAAKASSKTLQLLNASAKGKFSTKGKYSAATVLGTKWTVADRCDGTLTHDITDSVKVTDFVHHKTVTLHAGQSYLATKP